MGMMGWFNKPLLGVDLGSRTIKGLRLKKRKDRIVLDGYFFHDLSQTSDEYPKVSHAEETLKAGVELQKLRQQRYAATIPDREVLHVVFDLPKLKPSELKMAVRHELSEHTGIPAEELAFDFKVADAPQGVSADEQLSISAYGTRRKIVEDLVHTLHGASLKAKVVEPDTLAIRTMLEFNEYIDAEGVYVVFDLGERHLTATLLCEGDIRHSRSTATGLGKINDVLMERLNFTYEQAEQQKLKYDFNSSNRANQDAERIIDEVYASIFSDAKEAMEVFRRNIPDAASIQKILLVGGGSQTRNIEKVFEMFFRVPATVVNPFKNIDIFSDTADGRADEIGALAPFMAAAVGSALGSFK